MKFAKIIYLSVLLLIFNGCADREAAVKMPSEISAEIPAIERWENITDKDIEVENRNKEIFARLFRENRENGLGGQILYYQVPGASKPMPIIKAWYSADYNQLRTALLTDEKNWVIGDIGEEISITYEYNNNKKTVIFRFTGKHSNISKKVYLKFN